MPVYARYRYFVEALVTPEPIPGLGGAPHWDRMAFPHKTLSHAQTACAIYHQFPRVLHTRVVKIIVLRNGLEQWHGDANCFQQ